MIFVCDNSLVTLYLYLGHLMTSLKIRNSQCACDTLLLVSLAFSCLGLQISIRIFSFYNPKTSLGIGIIAAHSSLPIFSILAFPEKHNEYDAISIKYLLN